MTQRKYTMNTLLSTTGSTLAQAINNAAKMGVTQRSHNVAVVREVKWVQQGNGTTSRCYVYKLRAALRC